MRQHEERIEHHGCPSYAALRLLTVGGRNRFGEPNWRIVWGYDRIVKITGRWDIMEPAKIIGQPVRGPDGRLHQPIIAPRLVQSKLETREVPKYLPGNCWHLERWRPPEAYGTPEQWRERGLEVEGGITVDTAGEYPARGDWELVLPLTDDGTPQGKCVHLDAAYVELVVNLVQRSDDVTPSQRKAAIAQREFKRDLQYTECLRDILREGRRAFGERPRIVVPGMIQ